MIERKPRTSFRSFGFSILITMFIALSLIVFAVLSLAAARNNYTHSQIIADNKADYYAACNIAENIIADISIGELKGYKSADGSAIEIARNGNQYSWTVAISDSRELQVSLVLTGQKCDITKWKTVNVSKGGSDEA